MQMKLLLYQVVMVPNKSRFLEQNGMTTWCHSVGTSGPYPACSYGL